MTGSWGDVCVHCVELLARVPLHVTLTAVFASVVGLFVLVCRRYCAYYLQLLVNDDG